jgi:hypothetical protein
MFLKGLRQPARTEKPISRVASKPVEESTTAGFYRWMAFGNSRSLRPLMGRWSVDTVDHLSPAPPRPAEGKTIDLAESAPTARRYDDFPMLPSFGRAKH